jgi:hypothetical protein
MQDQICVRPQRGLLLVSMHPWISLTRCLVNTQSLHLPALHRNACIFWNMILGYLSQSVLSVKGSRHQTVREAIELDALQRLVNIEQPKLAQAHPLRD